MQPTLRISASQLECWGCHERYRLRYMMGYSPKKPSIFMAFGSAIHRMAYGYWSGWDYNKSYDFALLPAMQDQSSEYWRNKFGAEGYTGVVYPHAVLARNSFVDTSLLTQKETEKWNERLDSLAQMASAYYEYQGVQPEGRTGTLAANERMIQWEWGEASGYRILCQGVIDRISDGKLVDTKTVTAMDRTWRVKEKYANLRKPQLGFYLRWASQAGVAINKVAVECIVRPYRGSAVEVVELDLTNELMASRERFAQQMDWAIREIAHYVATYPKVQPWPMNSELCEGKYSACDYDSSCSMLVDIEDQSKFVQIEGGLLNV